MGVSNQNETILQNFIRDQGITFPVLQDTRGIYFSYNLPGGQSPYPRDFIIKDRTIHFADTEYDPATMIRIIETLLDESTTGVNDADGAIPSSFGLASVYPNPFNAVVTFTVDNPLGQAVELAVFDLSGHQLDEIYAGGLAPGTHRFRWSGARETGAALTSGLYFIRLTGESAESSRKVVLLK